jgi:hypothetical protein
MMISHRSNTLIFCRVGEMLNYGSLLPRRWRMQLSVASTLDLLVLLDFDFNQVEAA